jgi:hypothetical protein
MSIEATKLAILDKLRAGRVVLKPDDFGLTPDELKQVTSTLEGEGWISKHNMPLGVGVNAELTTEGRAYLEAL